MSQDTKRRLKKWTRVGVLSTALLIGISFFYYRVFAVVVSIWDFSTDTEYTCEGVACPSTNVNVTGGNAVMVARTDDFVDDEQSEFNGGSYDESGANEGVTEWDTDHVGIEAYTIAPEATKHTELREPIDETDYDGDIIVMLHFDDGTTSQYFADSAYDNTSDTVDDDAARGANSSSGSDEPSSIDSEINTKFGRMLNFGGNDRVNLDEWGTATNDSNANGTFDDAFTNRTVAFWVRLTNSSTTQVLFKEGGASNGMAIYVEGNQFECSAWTDDGDAAGDMNAQVDSGTVTTDVWYHVVCVLDGTGTTMELYLDGVSQGTADPERFTTGGVIEGMNSHTGDDNLCFNDGSAYFNDGANRTSNDYCQSDLALDEFAVFDIALTAAQVKRLYQVPDPWAGLYHFDEDSGTFTDSGQNGNDVTTNNSVSYQNQGVNALAAFDDAAGFDAGGDYLEVTADPTFAATDALTLQAWYYPTTLPSGASEEDYIISSSGGTDDYSMSIFNDTNGDNLLRAQWGSNTYTGTTNIASTATWYHVAAVFNQGFVYLYINGVLEHADTYSGSLTTGAAGVTVRFGDDSGGGSDSMIGRLDDAVILTRAKTSEEIRLAAGAYPGVATYKSSTKNAVVSKPWNRFQWTEDVQYGPMQSSLTNLVHLWSLDQSTPTDAVGSNDLTVTGTTHVYSKFGQGHYFDADTDSLISGSALSLMSEFTMMVWARFSEADPGVGEFILDVGAGDPRIFRHSANNIQVLTENTTRITSNRKIVDTMWHHYAITYSSGNGLALYIDGVADTTGATGGASEASTIALGDAGTNNRFNGSIDEVAIFDAELNATTIANYYKAQANQLKFVTRSCANSSCSADDWKGADGVALMDKPITLSNTVALWHFDETSYTGTAATKECLDTTFNNNDGYVYNFADTVQSGLYERAVEFNGDDQYIEVEDDSTLQIDTGADDVSIEAWVWMDEQQLANAVIIEKSHAGVSEVTWSMEIASDQRLQMRVSNGIIAPVTHTSSTPGIVPVGEWAHLVAVYTGGSVKFYINGVADGDFAQTGDTGYDSSALYIGNDDPDGNRPGFKGKIDMIQIYDVDISGDVATYFAQGNPYNYKQIESNADPLDADAIFFQYKAILYSHDGSQTPHLESALIRNSTYYTLDPYIENVNPWAYDTLSGFSETPGGGNQATYRYVLKDQSGGTYQYWDGDSWENSNASWDQANTAADINTNAASFPAGGANGRLYWRALMRNTGEQIAELSAISATVAERVDITAPTGQTYDVADTFDVTWTFTGDPVNLDIEWSIGSGWTSLANDVAVDGAANGCTDPGAFAGCWRGTVPDAIDNDFQIRITQSGGGVTDTSGNNTVNGSVQVTEPLASTVYAVGDPMTIKWIANGTIGTANDTVIEIDSVYAGSNFTAPGVLSFTTTALNTNNGFVCTPPSVSPPQYGGCWVENAPDAISAGNDVRIRVTEGSWSDMSDDYTITGSLTLVKPAQDDVWKAETALDGADNPTYVEWQFAGSVGTLILEFDETGAFSGNERIVATGLVRNTNNSTSCTPTDTDYGCYVLSGTQVPQADELTSGSQARFRLRATAPNPDVESSSEPQFVVTGWYNVTTPVNVTSWNVGASESIEWETHGSGMGNVEVQYCDGPGCSWVDITPAGGIADTDGDSNSYTWTNIPDFTCDNPGALGCDEVKVRIIEEDGGGVNDESQEFTVLPTVAITNPPDTSFQISASGLTVDWTNTGTMLGDMELYYSTDGQWSNSCTAATGAGKCLVCSTDADGGPGNTGSCGWANVPDTPSLTVNFMAESAMANTITSTTTTNSSIHGKFTADLPSCAPDCVSETTVNLTYTETTLSNNIGSMKIYYSTNGFTSSTLIDEGPNDGVFDGSPDDGPGDGTLDDDNGPWFLPQNIVHDNVQIRVADALDTNFDSAGDSNVFNAVAGFRMITPDLADDWKVGETKDIQWAFTGTVGSIGLYYCTDGTITCGSPVEIVDPFPSNNIAGCVSPSPGPNETVGCFRWNDGATGGVGDVRGDQVRIFVRDVDANCNPSASCGTRPRIDVGNSQDLTIMPALSVVSPSAGSLKIDAGDTYTVEWDSQGTPLANVELFYSDDGVAGTYNHAIGTNPHNNTTQAGAPSSPNNNYGWTTPTAISTSTIKYAVRVQDPDTANFPNAADNSDNEFDIVARFDLSPPDGGENWMVLTNHNLDWTPYGDVTNVTLEYSNDLIGWTTIIQDSPTQGETPTTATGIFANASRPFTWKVPNVSFMVNDNVKIRILDADTGHILRDTPVESSAFNVLPNITIIEPPEVGQKWRETQTRIVRWKMLGHNADIFTVDLEYSTDDLGDDNTTFDDPQLIKLNAINGINIDNGGCLLEGVNPDEDEGCYAWSIPASLIDSTVYLRVKDSDSGNPDSTVIASNGVSSVFEVFESSSITVEQPNGATYAVDDQMDIIWSGTGDILVDSRFVEIRYTTNGSDYTSIANVDANTDTGGCSSGGDLGCYRLNAPDAISTTFQVEVRDQSDSTIYDLSTDNTINGNVTISAPTPAGGDTFVVDDTLIIQWVVFGGTIGLANDTTIEFDSQYAGSNFSNPGLVTITTSATNDDNGFGGGCPVPSVSPPQYGGCYEYPLPNAITNAADMRVRVTDGSWSGTSGDHTLTGSVTLTSPRSGGLDTWKVETNTDTSDNFLDVEWTYKGTLGTLDLELDDEGAFSGNERTIVSGLQYNTTNGTSCSLPTDGGCYRLSGAEVPQKDETTGGAQTARFRVTATTPNPDVVSSSEPQFEIQGWFDMQQPANTDLWLVSETTRQIQWETHGNGLGNIDLEYRVDGGAWNGIVSNLGDSDIDAAASHIWASIPNADCAGINLGCDKVEVRIKQNVGSIEDISQQFTVKPQVLITDPSPLRFLIGAQNQTIYWTLEGTVDTNVDLYYSTDQQWGNACTASTGAGKCPVGGPLCSAAGTALECDWPSVPDIPALDVKFLAEANSDTTVNSETGSFSSIHGNFTVNLPSCAPDCLSENEYDITWNETTLSNNISIVKVFYSTNAFTSSTLIANTPNDDEAYDGTGDGGPWRIPENIVHDNLALRVVDLFDTNFDSAGESNVFNSVAELRMISPNDGEEWAVGTSQDIQWGYRGTLSEVDIHYCTDGTITCGSPGSIANNVSANNAVGCTTPSPGSFETVGCYNWADATSTGVADIVDVDVRVFVRDSDTNCNPNDGACGTRPKIDDGSDDDVIVMPALTLVSPSASGLKIDAATSYDVEWDSQGTPLDDVNLHYQFAGGGYTNDIPGGGNPTSNVTQAGPPSSPNNTLGWTTPATISTASNKYSVRVQNPDTGNYPSSVDTSDNEFDIVARFDLTDPAGAESWMVLTNHNLNWNSFGTVTNVQIQYSNDAIGWTTIVQQSPADGETPTTGTGLVANANPFIWRVPNAPNIIDDNVKIQVIDVDTGHIVRDIPVASSAFNVIPNIQIIDPPEAGIIWRETQTRVIRWKMVGDNAIVSTVDIEYDTTDNTFANAANVVIDANHGTNTDNGGCSLQGVDPGETEGCYAWAIPGSLIDTTVWVRVKDSDAGHPDSTAVTTNGVSPVFEIGKIATVTLVEPIGETMNVDANMEVIWDATGALADSGAEVYLDYRIDGGSFVPLTGGANVDADAETGGCDKDGHLGCIMLKAPDAISGAFQVRVRDQNDTDINHLGGNNTINGDVDMVLPSPTVGATYVVGDTLTISWIVYGENIGVANDTVIEFDSNYAGSNFTNPGLTQITSTASNDANGFGCSVPVVSSPQVGGCYEWTPLPDEITSGADFRVRVSDGAATGMTTDHTLTGSVAFQSPTNSDTWKVETQTDTSDVIIDVEWTFTGDIGTLDLHFDDEGLFAGNERLIQSGLNHDDNNGTLCVAPGSGGCYRLSGAEVPQQDETTSNLQTAKFRLTATTPDPDVVSDVPSTQAFEVEGWFDLTGPTNTDTWLVGEINRQVSWETHGDNVGNVDVEWQINGGAWNPLDTPASQNVGDSDIDSVVSYTWLSVLDADCVPLNLGCNNVKVRVRQTGTIDGNTIIKESQAFTIKPQVLITDPPQLTFEIGETGRTMDWTTQGTVDSGIDVFYSTDQDWGTACTPATGAGKCALCSVAQGNTSCPWPSIPDIPSLTVKFQAEANTDTTVKSETASFARIHGNFTSNLPDCHPNCFSEMSTDLSWTESTLSNAITDVKIFYSTTGFQSATLIDTTDNDGDYDGGGTDTKGPWVIPENVVHDNVQLRVVDELDTALDSAGDSGVFITPAELRLIAPLGGQIWSVGDVEEIQWGYTGTVANIAIKYCLDGTITCGGAAGTVVANLAANNSVGCTLPGVNANETAGCYSWADPTTGGVANERDAQVRIFLQDADLTCNPTNGCGTRPTVDDGSTSNIKFVTNLDITSPTSGQELDAATAYDIIWDSHGTPLTTVDLVLSYDGGAIYNTDIELGETNSSVAGSPTSNTANPQWTTPAFITDTGLSRSYSVRVRDPDTTDFLEANSSMPVDIVAHFTYDEPTSSSEYLVGNNYTIDWNTFGNVTNVQLEYYTTQRGTWTPIVQTGAEGGAPTPDATNANNEYANDGTFVWQVPNVINILSSGAQVRVIDGDTGHVLRSTPDESDAFTIVANITMIAPAGTETFGAGELYNIQWKTAGTLAAPATVDIQYDLNSADTWSGTVANDLTNGQNGACALPSVGASETAGCYEWQLDVAAIHADVRFRVVDSDAGHPASTLVAGNGESASFTIQDNIIILQPDGGDQLTGGDQFDIKWEVYGTFGNVDLHYSNDGFANDITLILADATHDDNSSGCIETSPGAGGDGGCYRWDPIDNVVDSGFRLRVKDVDSPFDEKQSAGTWEIVGPLALTYPNGGAGTYFTKDDLVNITWANNQTLPIEPFIDLEYSDDNGDNWYQVEDSLGVAAENEPNSGAGGSYEWEVPDSIADQYLVRVIEHDNPAKGDQSNETFKVVGDISLTTLQGSDDQYYINQSVPISFTVDGTPAGNLFNDVALQYSDQANFSSNVVNITTNFLLDHGGAGTNCPSSVCTFNWVVDDTNTITNTEVYYIRVIDLEQTEGASSSANQFQVYGTLTLTAEHPCGGDNLCFIGETPNPTITFTKAGNSNGSFFDAVDIQYSDDAFANNIITIESGWSLDNPSNCTGGNCSYTWDVTEADNTIIAAPAYFLRVIDPDNTLSVDTGTTAFEIAGRLALTTLNPGTGDDVFKIGTPEDIVFIKDGNANGTVFDDVVIEYSTQVDFSSNVVPIDSSFALSVGNCPGNVCTKSWSIDNSHSLTQDPVYYIRVRDPGNADSTTGSSQNQFELAGDLAMTMLDGGDLTYKVGDQVSVTWSKKGEPNSPIFDDVAIEYSDDGFANNTIAIDTVNMSGACSGTYPNETCTYNWTLDNNDPIITTQTYKIRVRDPDNAESEATTQDSFKIAGDLTLTTLMGADDTYEIGEQVPITWTAEGIANGLIFDNVDIQYSNDNFSSNVSNIAINLPLTSVCSAGNCTFNWDVPDAAIITNAPAYNIRIRDLDNPTESISNSTNQFQLAGHLNLTTQTTSTTYTVGQVVPIIFDWNGDAQGTLYNDVDIEYSNNNFVSDFRTIGLGQSFASPQAPFSCNPTQCTYSWTVPSNATLSSGFIYGFRVIDPDNSDGTNYSVSISSGLIKLIGGFSWNQPTGGTTKWPVGTDQTVEWSTLGDISNVKVSYSTDGFINENFFEFTGGKLQVEPGVTTFAAASLIATNPNDVPGTTAYALTVPDAISNSFNLRVYDSVDATVLATSDDVKVHSVFTVSEPDTTTKLAATTYPNGIQWTNTGTVNKVKVEYNLGSGWNPVTSVQSGGATDDAGIINTNPGQINWTTPNAKAASAQIRVGAGLANNDADADTLGLSSNFKISAKVVVLSPNGENNPFWKVGDIARNITWSTIPVDLGGSDQVDILYSTNGALGNYNLVTNGDDTDNDGTFNWNPIPDTISNNVFIRVVDSADSDGKDESDAAFSIAGDLSITSGNNDAPLGGESWPVYKATPAALAQAQDIKWTSTGTAMNLVELRASNDGFGGVDVQIQTNVVNVPGQNTFSWQISDTTAPTTPIGSNWQIKVLNITPNTPAEEVISDGFNIRAGLYVSSHNAVDDSCEIGGTCTITWDTAGLVNDVVLEYSTSGTGGPWARMHVPATLGDNPETYDWSVPGALTPGFNARYRVTDAVVGHPSASDYSDANSRVIAIFPSADIKLNPGGAVLGGQDFSVGQTITVDYTYVGVVGAINVEISLDEDSNASTFDNPTEVISSEPTNGDATGQFSYQFTDLLSGGVDTTRIQFRILDASVPDDSINNVTNGVSGTVRLGGAVTVTGPNAGTERWEVGSPQTITWTNAGNSITNVMIEYDDNAGFSSPTTIVARTDSTAGVGGSYPITVDVGTFPDIASLYHNDIFIRVSDADTAIHGPATDNSDNGHLITGKLDYTQPSHSPTLNEAWDVSSPHTITWNTEGNITNVDIYYSDTGNFGDAVKINDEIAQCPGGGAPCANNPDADTSVTWTPPVSTQVSTTAKIWIEDYDDNTTPQLPTYEVQTSSPVFEIHGTLTLTAPLLDGQLLKAASSVTFTWTTLGDTLNNVDIEYSRDNDANLLTFDDPQPIQMNHDNTGGNRGTFDWTVPSTFNDGTVYVRIQPVGTTNGFDTSGSFKIMPDIQVVTPSGGELWEIGIQEDIFWNIVGVVNNIKIRYSIDNGNNYPNGAPYEIVTLDPNTGGYALTGANAKYTWNDAQTGGVADTRTQQAKIMIELLDDVSGDADAEQLGNFTIAARFVLSAPTINQEFQVDDNFNLQWDWGGTIANVVLEYSDTYDGVTPATFDAGSRCMKDYTRTDCTAAAMLVTNGAGASGTGYTPPAITVGDDISRPGDPQGDFPYHVRISDPTDPNVFDIFPDGAGEGFKIKSNFTVTSPDLGTEEWFVGNLSHSISWTNTGTVDNVVLEYTKDNWATPLCVAGGTSPNCNAIPNSSPYSWQIADDNLLIPYVCNSEPDPNPNDTVHPCKIDTVRVRAVDSGDPNVLDASDNDFTARYVAKRWTIQDSTTGQNLDSITMFENTIHKTRAYGGQNVPGIVSPYVLWSPANTAYTIAFQKTGFTDLFDVGQLTTSTDQLTGAGDEMVDEEQTVFLDSIIAHNDVINTSYEYTSGAPDQIVFTVWYVRDGGVVTTSQSADLHIYDGAVEIITQSSSTQNPAGSGVYIFTISPSGLTEGVDYEARNTITLASGAQLQGYTIVNITSQSQNQDTASDLSSITPVIEANLDTSVDAGFTSSIANVDAAKTTISDAIGDTSGETLKEKLDAQSVLVQDELDLFEETANDAIASMQDEIDKAGIRLIIPDTVKIGSTETLRLSTVSGMSPSIDILCPDNTPIHSGLSLAEDEAGIYTVDVEFDSRSFSCAAAKAVTVSASVLLPSHDINDPPFTATAIGGIFITTTDLDTIQGLAAAGLNAEKAAKDARDAIEQVSRSLQGDGSILNSLQNLQRSVNRIPMLLGGDKSSITQMRSTLESIAGQLGSFMGKDGYDMRSILKQEVGEGMRGIRNSADRTLAATEIMAQLVERNLGQNDEPVVETYYEIASVKLRVVAVNPSQEKSQIVPIKIYLPQEIIPDDIIDMGDLKVGYDSAKGLYFAFSDGVELAPKETRVFEVHLEDVWRIEEEDMQRVRDRTSRAMEYLDGTEFFDKAKEIVDTIDLRLSGIEAKQNDETITREEHIGAYRVNLVTMKQINRDLDIIEKILQHAGAPPSMEFLRDTVFETKEDVKKSTTWFIILGIVGFLMLLGVGFYIRWFFMVQSQKKAMKAAGAVVADSKKVEKVDLPKKKEGGSDTNRQVG